MPSGGGGMVARPGWLSTRPPRPLGAVSRRRIGTVPAAFRLTEATPFELGADSISYLSLEGVYEAISGSRATHCDACFSGEYPLAGTAAAQSKDAFEHALPLARL